ncbi:ATP-grasp domain-containing protein [Methylorubrum salsuginis]|uniref:ATP-grasp domain-containing protein n=1 Tax=Methylorubrum salsuginis TaxID=414703 RepID=UPI001FCD74CA|nr:ATP-grasp domain-containing protein [Methylorubrum salsuginis]
MREGGALLIAAQSGRALAQAARRAGLRPFVLDLFGDEDTLALAEAHRPLPGRFGAGRRDRGAVLAGLEALAAEAGSAPLGVVLGSGFEGAPALMAEIAGRFPLLGATPAAVAALKDPAGFAALCERLAIPHPAITHGPRGTRVPLPLVERDRGGGGAEGTAEPHPAPPPPPPSSPRAGGEAPLSARLASAERGAWLLKRAGGCGGSHVRLSATGTVPPGHYLQQKAPGRAFALNFLSDGTRIEPLALTEQWQVPSRLRPFRYGGALARGRDEPHPVAAPVREAVIEAVGRIVRATGLAGLASADLLIDGDDWRLLEINPRPGATLDVLDRRPTPLLLAHIEASLGRLPIPEAAPPDATGAEICYAARTYAALPPFDWPDHVRDRPRAGIRVGRDAPLCTVTATGPDAAAAIRNLRARADALRARLDDTENRHEFQHDRPEPQRAGGPAGREPRR